MLAAENKFFYNDIPLALLYTRSGHITKSLTRSSSFWHHRHAGGSSELLTVRKEPRTSLFQAPQLGCQCQLIRVRSVEIC